MFFNNLLVVATVISLVSASPIEHHDTKRPIVVPMRRITNVSSVSGKDRLAARRGLTTLGSRASSGALQNWDIQYVAPVEIGGKIWQLNVDTGSANTWCGARKPCEKSATGISTGRKISLIYGKGEMHGIEYKDTVSFAGLTVKSQSIGSATSTKEMIMVDGIFGLGPVELTEYHTSGIKRVPTFMNNLKAQGSIATEVFAISYRPESGNHMNDINGELTIGGIDTSKYTGDLTYFPRVTTGPNAGYWGIAVTKFTYGSTTLLSNVTAVVDSGSTMITLPTAAYNAFLSASGGQRCDQDLVCWTTKPTANFGITFGSRTYTLTPAQYLFPAAQYAPWDVPAGKYWAYIDEGDHSKHSALIGQKFLENYYSVYDAPNARIGFAVNS
ncbi:related to rhizopuspepsin-2 precursor [Rhynchosporium agropyri]|uniref:Related to rhizopuspepsin-2 n=1 Tax=Rhynchosporium agropyri TaxID=914238 RepID=A0A1E1LN73_9HELO|nr:related to rhizopuspepsin-2 precursor [Rhynchosporium agropyri]